MQNPFTHLPLVSLAFEYAKAAHERVGQMRKFGPVPKPYIIHPVQVAQYTLATEKHPDEETAATAVLHDVLEDTLKEGQSVHDASYELRAHFLNNGVEMAVAERLRLRVLQVTDTAKPEDGNRAARMAINCAHAAKAEPEQQTVKLADIKSNMPSIVKHNPGFAHKWTKEKAAVVQHMTQGDPTLLAEVRDMLDRYRKGMFNPDNYDIV
jgi:(p)ppGpp synthase/HD superfamily hydrolase